MPVRWEELRLLWTPELFRQEAAVVLQHETQDDETVGWLLDEAFHGGRAVQLYREAGRLERVTQMTAAVEGFAAVGRGEKPAPFVRPQDDLFTAVIDAAHKIPRWKRKRLYSERQNPQPERPWSMTDLKAEVVNTLRDMDATGYFEAAFGSRCPDSWDDPDTEGQRLLSDAIGQHDERLWPLGFSAEGRSSIEDEWGDDLFLDLVEALHDQVARPLRRRWHDHHHEFDYDNYSRASGQAVYRWKMNSLIDRSELGLRLAEHGPDAGLLIEVTGDARDDLVEQVLGSGEPIVADRVGHAVAQFRRRDSTREIKREAARALADVLEQRKALVKAELLSKDANALFQIANEFDIRHMNERQKADYDPLFLDWVFWWYLATVDLTNRLIEQQTARPW